LSLESIPELKNVTVMKKAMIDFRLRPQDGVSILIWDENE